MDSKTYEAGPFVGMTDYEVQNMPIKIRTEVANHWAMRDRERQMKLGMTAHETRLRQEAAQMNIAAQARQAEGLLYQTAAAQGAMMGRQGGASSYDPGYESEPTEQMYRMSCSGELTPVTPKTLREELQEETDEWLKDVL